MNFLHMESLLTFHSLISIVSGIFEMLTIIDPSSSYRHVFLPYNIYCRFTATLRRPKMRSVLFRPFDIVIVYQIVIVYSQVYSIDSVTISSSRMHLQLYYGVRILPSLIYAADRTILHFYTQRSLYLGSRIILIKFNKPVWSHIFPSSNWIIQSGSRK